MKRLISLVLTVFALVFAKAWYDAYSEQKDMPGSDSFRLVPGKTVRIDVPDIFGTEPLKRIFEMRIPESYRAPKDN